MNSENMARVLQNMIEEAEENLLYLEKVHEGREHLTSRFAELKEAMDLEAELGGPLLSEDKPSPEPFPASEPEAAEKGKSLPWELIEHLDRYFVNNGLSDRAGVAEILALYGFSIAPAIAPDAQESWYRAGFEDGEKALREARDPMGNTALDLVEKTLTICDQEFGHGNGRMRWECRIDANLKGARALLPRNPSGALEADEPIPDCGEPESTCPCERIFSDCPAPECGMFEPVLACATGRPCSACEVANDCGTVDETWLEAREREENLKVKLADKLDLIAAKEEG